jgi:hypothetical protein
MKWGLERSACFVLERAAHERPSPVGHQANLVVKKSMGSGHVSGVHRHVQSKQTSGGAPDAPNADRFDCGLPTDGFFGGGAHGDLSSDLSSGLPSDLPSH